VVVTLRPVPGVGPVLTSGIVTQVRARQEGASFGSDVFLISEGVLPARTQEIAEVSTTRVEPEIYVPPRPGEVVRRATGTERAQALYFDQMTNKVPVGRGRDGAPIFVNMEFLDGTRGAHVSISGISGVATKTSFALFLLHSIFRSGALRERAVNAKALVFSVKGEDLLFLDQPNARLDDDLRAQYADLGLPAEAFASAGFWAPPIPDDTTGRPNVTGRTSGVEAFWWTIAEFCERQLLPYVFADSEDDRQQYTIVIHQVAARLRRDAEPYGTNGAVKVDGVVVSTYENLVNLIVDRLLDDDTRADWAGPVTGTGTANAFVRRLRSSLRPLSSIIRADLTDMPRRQVSTSGQQLTVVDLHNLPERAQRFVVGVVLAAETVRKEDAGAGVARHHLDRRAADRQRGRAAHRVQLGDPGGRPPRLGRGRAARVRLPACLAAGPRDDRQAGRDVRLPAADPGAPGGRVPVPRLGDPAVGMRRPGPLPVCGPQHQPTAAAGSDVPVAARR
jgi:uncharacterized protein